MAVRAWNIPKNGALTQLGFPPAKGRDLQDCVWEQWQWPECGAIDDRRAKLAVLMKNHHRIASLQS